jgi:hypothetical protein
MDPADDSTLHAAAGIPKLFQVTAYLHGNTVTFRKD